MFMWIAIAVAAVLVIILGVSSYVKAPSDQAYIITGLRKTPKILIGKSGFKIPFFQRLDKLKLGAIQIDVKTASAVPTAEYINVRVDSNVNVAIGNSEEEIALAAKHFLNVDKSVIKGKVKDLLEGNVREIIGQMKLTEMVFDRKGFSEKVQENAVPDLARFGLELISFNVQSFADENGVIENLGIENVEKIRKEALIAKSDAQREVACAEAENAKQANDAKAVAAEAIAVRNNELEIKKAALKKQADTQNAIAEAAFSIEEQNQRQSREVAATNADIARVERETELKRQQIELTEKELDAIVRKKAEAEKYAAEQAAEAELFRRQKIAEAEAYERIKQAEAHKAEADAAKYAALAEAEGIAARGQAEADALAKKAEAQKLMEEAAVLQMYFDCLPRAVANAAAPLTNVDKITLWGDGCQSKLVGDVTQTVTQVQEAIKEATGIDLTHTISGFLGGKAAKDN